MEKYFETIFALFFCFFLHFHPPVAKLLTTVCATGGGAFKFEEEFHKVSCDDDGKKEFLIKLLHGNFRRK